MFQQLVDFMTTNAPTSQTGVRHANPYPYQPIAPRVAKLLQKSDWIYLFGVRMRYVCHTYAMRTMLCEVQADHCLDGVCLATKYCMLQKCPFRDPSAW